MSLSLTRLISPSTVAGSTAQRNSALLRDSPQGRQASGGIFLPGRRDSTKGRTHLRPVAESGEHGSEKSSTDSTRHGETAWVAFGRRSLAIGSSLSVLLGISSLPALAGTPRDLKMLAEAAVQYDEALSNGKPTVVEFYADWCEACQESAPVALQVEALYRDRINFVMINIDNPKWAAEVDEFGVDGIPHLSFLSAKGDELSYIGGKYSRRVLEENLQAILGGAESLPYLGMVGEYSKAQARPATQAEPRSHGL